MLKLANPKIVGEGEHRSGWPYVIDCCKPLFDDNATVLFDDFLERTFLYDQQWHGDVLYTQPWVAVVHHPPDMPSWYMPKMHLQKLASHSRFQASRENLRLVISMGDPLTAWVKETWPEVPVVAMKHPTGRPLMYWSPERFKQNKYPMLLQVGWFLRNLAGIYQCPRVPGLSKGHLKNVNPWVEYANWLCKKTMQRARPNFSWDDSVIQVPQQSAARYDVVLSENVVFVELLSAVANNTVVECIARNTPLVINRHPGPMSYLGEDYPLYFDDLSEVPGLVTEDRIMAAHHYLKTMDKWWIRGPLFAEHLRAACVRHVPELFGYRWPELDMVDCDL